MTDARRAGVRPDRGTVFGDGFDPPFGDAVRGVGPSRKSVRLALPFVYAWAMDVAVTELRAHLSDWLARARQGDQIVVTDRGIPVARLLGVDATPTLVRLTQEGAIARPARDRRPRAGGRPRPRPRRPVADRVGEQRR